MASGSTVYKNHHYQFSDDGKGAIVAERRGEPHHGGQAFSSDGGNTFQPFGEPALPDADMVDVAQAYANATRPKGPVDVTRHEATEEPKTVEDLDNIAKKAGVGADSKPVDPKTKN